MKKLIFLLMTCGMHVCSFPQTEIAGKNIISSDKYEITPIKGLKKGMGRLNLNFPEGVEWSVDVYNASSKFITNFSIIDQRNFGDKKNYQDLAAGLYHFKVNTVLVENVPIEDGKETKLRTGVLDITTTGNWELRSEDNKKFLTSGNKPKKIALPAGSYFLVEGKEKHAIEVKDEITKEVTTEPDLTKWEIYTVKTKMSGTGRLNMEFPAGLKWMVRVYNPNMEFYNCDRELPFNGYIILKPGNYKVIFDINFQYLDVPIEEGKETRLRLGTLELINTNNSRQVHLFNESKQQISVELGSKTLIPIGHYYLKIFSGYHDQIYYPVTIQDQMTVSFEVNSQGTPAIKASRPGQYPYEIKKSENIPEGKSRLTMIKPEFPPIQLPTGGTIILPEIICKTYVYLGDDKDTAFNCNKLPMDIIPGHWATYINGLKVGTLPYHIGEQVRLQVGFLPINMGGQEQEFGGLENYFDLGEQPGTEFKEWELRNTLTDASVEGSKGGIYAYPPGKYVLKKISIINQTVYYDIEIKEGEFAKIKKRNN